MTNSDELIFLRAEVDRLKKENEQSKKENEQLNLTLKILEIRERQKEKELQKLHNENFGLQEKTNISTLAEQKLKTEIETWERFVEDLAHTINTDVFIAVSNLDKHKDIPRINKALHHTKQIRDFTNLIMWYLKRRELKLSGEKESINLKEVIEKQISEIKDGISALRIASDEHEENILKMEIAVDSQSEQPILIPKEIASAVKLIVRDLLRNAIKNTNEATPSVNVNLKSEEKVVIAEIVNNIAIKEEFSKWFNNESKEEPLNISKSSKVGLRIIKMWIELLKIDAKLIPDEKQKFTITRIIFPKEIEFESN